jgi:diguanylate cyclase (GGDEF)-like protein/PAS domain S-box-containing protein
MDKTDDEIYFKDLKSRFIKVNKATARILGLTAPNEAIGKSDFDFFPEEYAKKTFDEEKKILNSKIPFLNTVRKVTRHARADRYVATSKFPLFDNEKKIIGTFGISKDVTQLVQASESLKPNESKIQSRLEAMLEPEGDIGIELSEIVDVGAIQDIMDAFFRLTGIGIALLDKAGQVLVKTGWQDICTKFHRTNIQSRQNCIESDTVLSLAVEPGQFKAYRCKNNMWDIVTPLYIGGRHMGNLFLGQFFYADEKQDYETFRAQAKKFGFCEPDYIAALDRVPRWSRKKVEDVMRFYARIATVISTLSYNKLILARALKDKTRTEKALQQSEQYNRSIVELLPDLIIRTNKQGEYLDIITFGNETLIYPKDEMLGKKIPDMLPENEANAVMGCIKKSIEDSSLEVIEYELSVPNGKIYFEARVISFGKNEAVALIRDITESKQAEKAIRESEAKYRQIADNVSDVVWRMDLDLKLTYVSPSIQKLTGESPEAHMKRSLAEKITFDSIKLTEKLFAEEMEKEKDHQSDKDRSRFIELEHYRADGTTVWVMMHVSFIRDANGKAIGFQGVTRDITEKKRAEEALKKQIRFEKMIAKISSIFANLSSEKIDEGVKDALKHIGYFFKVDRSYVFQFSKDGEKIKNTHEWVSESTMPLIDKYPDFKVEDLPWWSRKISSLRHVHIPDIHVLSKEAQAEMNGFRNHRVQSILNIPMMIKGRLFGFFGFDTVKEKRKWTKEEISLLEVVAETLSSAFIRQQTENELREQEKFQKLLMNLATGFIHVSLEKVDHSINEMLEAVGKFTKIDRVYIFSHDYINQVATNTHEWCADGITPEIGNLQATPFSFFTDMMDSFQKGDIVEISNVQDMPKNHYMRPILDQQNICSLVLLPLLCESKNIGFVGFDSVREIRHFGEMEIALLKVLAGILSSAIARKQNEEALRKSETRYRQLIETLQEGIWAIDDNGLTTYVNEPLAIMIGYKVEEIQGRHFFDFIDKEEIKKAERYLQRMAQGMKTQNEFTLIHKNGNSIYILMEAGPIFSERGNFMGSIAGIQDITDRKQSEEKIFYMSFHDRLTGLHNRAYMEEEMIRLDTKRQFPLSIIMADLNGLKLLNDTYGHSAGDEMLKKVAAILKKSCRREEILARWGGDEFVILLPQTAREEVEKLCERIRSHCVKAYYKDIPVSIALGSATKYDLDINMEEILRKAEDSMYKQKLLESRSTRSAVITAFLKTLKEKSFETESHVKKMQGYALKIGKKLHLSESDLRRLCLLAMLHDIGKINIPEKILGKKGPLTQQEWQIIKEHPQTGYRIALATPEFSYLAEDILSHHERWDGLGYPRGLKGSQIPLHARIVAVADAYEVMRNGRVYKKPLSKSDAVAELQRCAGNQFDPTIIKKFIEVLE